MSYYSQPYDQPYEGEALTADNVRKILSGNPSDKDLVELAAQLGTDEQGFADLYSQLMNDTSSSGLERIRRAVTSTGLHLGARNDRPLNEPIGGWVYNQGQDTEIPNPINDVFNPDGTPYVHTASGNKSGLPPSHGGLTLTSGVRGGVAEGPTAPIPENLTSSYLQQYGDVADAYQNLTQEQIDGWFGGIRPTQAEFANTHFNKFGQGEGRAWGNTGEVRGGNGQRPTPWVGSNGMYEGNPYFAETGSSAGRDMDMLRTQLPNGRGGNWSGERYVTNQIDERTGLPVIMDFSGIPGARSGGGWSPELTNQYNNWTPSNGASKNITNFSIETGALLPAMGGNNGMPADGDLSKPWTAAPTSGNTIDSYLASNTAPVTDPTPLDKWEPQGYASGGFIPQTSGRKTPAQRYMESNVDVANAYRDITPEAITKWFGGVKPTAEQYVSAHHRANGAREGRTLYQPNSEGSLFNASQQYLVNNPDVANAYRNLTNSQINDWSEGVRQTPDQFAQMHYLTNGRDEGRNWDIQAPPVDWGVKTNSDGSRERVAREFYTPGGGVTQFKNGGQVKGYSEGGDIGPTEDDYSDMFRGTIDLGNGGINTTSNEPGAGFDTIGQIVGQSTGSLDSNNVPTNELIPGLNALYDSDTGTLVPAVVDANGELQIASDLADVGDAQGPNLWNQIANALGGAGGTKNGTSGGLSSLSSLLNQILRGAGTAGAISTILKPQGVPKFAPRPSVGAPTNWGRGSLAPKNRARGGSVDGGLDTLRQGLHAMALEQGLTKQPAPERMSKRGFLAGDQGGQTDNVPINASHGEYVMDAESVAALGDGNSEAGAAKLDQMRHNIRKHKRSAPVSKIPPKAKSIEKYLKG